MKKVTVILLMFGKDVRYVPSTFERSHFFILVGNFTSLFPSQTRFLVMLIS